MEKGILSGNSLLL